MPGNLASFCFSKGRERREGTPYNLRRALNLPLSLSNLGSNR